MYALMFKGGDRLFALAVDREDEIVLVNDDNEAALLDFMSAKYASWDMPGWSRPAAMVRHAATFGPVTVHYADTPAFMSDVVGGGPDGSFAEVSGDAGRMGGIECVGPRAREAYASGRPLPLYRA